MKSETEHIFILLILFQIKQFVADFPLQQEFMLKKRLPDWNFFIPLLLHSLVHGIFTLFIVLVFAPHLWWLSLVDLLIHFSIDRLKSGPRYLGRFNDKTTSVFWNIFGLDQMLHHLTHIAIVAIIIHTEFF